VKTYVAFICLAAWTLAAIAQLIFTLGLPDKTIVSGVDVSHAMSMLHVRQAIFIGLGLASAIWACTYRKWRFPLVVASSLLYLLHWIPWRPLGEFGLSATVKSMYVLGSTPSLRFTSLVRDALLPIAFAVVITLAVPEARKPPVLSRTS
jgi:hypothetical protein